MTGARRSTTRRGPRLPIALAVLAVLVAGCTATGTGTEPPPQHVSQVGHDGTPRPDHLVVVVLENHGPDQVLGSRHAPFLNRLASTGAVFTGATAITHPSQPNYLAMFSGSTQNVVDDNCPYTFDAPNLAGQLLDAQLTFASYAEDLPDNGSTDCESADYVRRHNPAADFSSVPSNALHPLADFPSDFGTLPTVSFVVPNLCHDMHDCGVGAGDSWLKEELGDYANWARTHNSMLIVTFDEGEDDSASNRIPLVFAGSMVRPGSYAEPVDHYRVLRTIEDMYGLPYAGHAAEEKPITTTWAAGTTRP